MYETETGWIHQHVKNVISIEVVQDWAMSRVLRIHTTSGDLFFKSCTSLPLSANETRLTEFLAHLYPHNLPDLLAVDVEHGWMLLGDVGANLRTEPHFEHWHEAVMRLAAIQHDSLAHLDQLQAAGCPDRRAASLEARIETILADDAMLSGLDAAEVDRLRSLAPRLRDRCQQLHRVTLTHGDVHGGNVGYKDGSPRFFDWSESCIAHPLYDLPVILRDTVAYFSPEQTAQVRDDYLACWEDGQQQWQIVRPVAALHHGMMYNGVAEVVIPGQPRVRVAGWLRDILAYLQ
ncbi:MAG: aminoglycoside phosphotransferase family protein [Chloroflexota bacterium]